MSNQIVIEIRGQIASRLDSLERLGKDITLDFIRDIVRKIIDEYARDIDVPEDTYDKVLFDLGNQYDIAPSEKAVSIHDDTIPRWFDSRKSEIDWDYWSAYRELLVRKGRAKSGIKENEKVIDSVLDFSGDPETPGPWSRKGLVMGNVQSGKTENYLGLINKAIDCGYKIIILLGGHLNDLRKQTQERVDEGVIGRESISLVDVRARTSPIGVGLIRNSGSKVHAYTTTAGDFSKPFALKLALHLTGLSDPAIFTVKKNTSVLESLYEWIKDYHDLSPEKGTKLELPLLLIDDEADYASVNTKADRDEITRTNEYIRNILSLFSRNTYVGYTATPFANIFIDPDPDDERDIIKDDLFPKHFLVKMSVPENYLGQDFYFAEERIGKPIVVITDNQLMLPIKHNSSDVVGDRAKSLERAIRTFINVIAIRSLRRDDKAHNTMLVNISHLNIHQNRLETLIEEYVDEIFEALESFTGLGMEEALINPIINELKLTFEKQFSIKEKFEDVFPLLRPAASKVKVMAVTAGKTLDYSQHDLNGFCVIVIGGHKLSRGLTLEGLSVSYFARNSKAYDTLMQMCRWFGYRPRYGDLCRVFLPFDSLRWYTFIASAIRELYKELELMSNMEKRPIEFGLKVRDHPGAMIVTARNKKGSAEPVIHKIDLWGRTQRRFRFKKDPEINKRNLKYAERFLTELMEDDTTRVEKMESGGRIFSDVEYSSLINFIRNIDLIEDDIGNDAMIRHLEGMAHAGLPKVKVCLFNQSGSPHLWWEDKLEDTDRKFLNEDYKFLDLNINLAKRGMKDDGKNYINVKSNLGNRDDEKLFLNKKEKLRIKSKKKNPVSFDYLVSDERVSPGLIIYLFGLGVGAHGVRQEERGEAEVYLGHGREATVGYSISFPRPESLKGKTKKEIDKINNETRHSYQAGKVYREQLELIDMPTEYFND